MYESGIDVQCTVLATSPLLGPSGTMKRKRSSTLELLGERQTHARRPQVPLQRYAEDKAAHFELEEMVCKLPVSVRSTFLMVFSPNGAQVASTHGDHKIYVCQVSTGRLLNTLEGHPRTPWCLAFHPTCNDLLASGCLGGEVRVWDLRGGGSEVWVCPEKSVITSLSFHPMENFIALSTVNRVHFWDWSRPEPFATTKTNSEREKVRLVRFSPQGDYLLTGITNAQLTGPIRHCRSSILNRLMTMYHRLGEMIPPSPLARHHASLQRRIARRGGHRRVTHDDIFELLRSRQLFLYQRAERSNPHRGNGWSQSPSELDGHPGGTYNGQSTAESAHNPLMLYFELRSEQHRQQERLQERQQQQPSPSQQPQQSATSASGSTSNGSQSYSFYPPFSLAGPSSSSTLPPFSAATTTSSSAFSAAGSTASNLGSSLSSSLPSSSRTVAQKSSLQSTILKARQRSLFTRRQPPASRGSSNSNSSNSNGDGGSSSFASSASQTDSPSGGQLNDRNAQRGDSSNLLETFNRLRALCSRLESQMLQHSENNQQQQQQLLHIGPSASASSASLPQPSSSSFPPLPSASSSVARTSSSSHASISSNPTLTRQHLPSTSSRDFGFPGNLNSSTDSLRTTSTLPSSSPAANDLDARSPTSSNESRSDISLSLVSLLSRLQESLQSLSEATNLTGINGDGAAARQQIREVRHRISEILERLENVSGYRERLQNLREQIYAAAERMARRNEEDDQSPSRSQQLDLAYCLWLVEMSLQLTDQMHRILRADYRLSTLHLTRGRREIRTSRGPRFEDDNSQQANLPSGVLPLSSGVGVGTPAAPNAPNLLVFGSSESESESEGEGERGSSVPPFTPPPFRAPQYNSARYPTANMGTMGPVTHRIQYWRTTGDEMIPQISDSRARVVVNVCKITNDGSVDVSPCGRLLVALVPDTVGVTLTVFSLEEASMGQVLYTWGFGPNAVSVSFSPLSRYIVVGLASSRYMSPQREVVAQIFRLGVRPVQGQTGGVLLEHVGNMSQPLLGSNASHQLSSLNCVRWLPNPGEGLVYGTNRGTLCICRPLCSVCQECSGEASVHGSGSRDGTDHRDGPGGLLRTRRDSFENLTAHVEETAMQQVLRRP